MEKLNKLLANKWRFIILMLIIVICSYCKSGMEEQLVQTHLQHPSIALSHRKECIFGLVSDLLTLIQMICFAMLVIPWMMIFAIALEEVEKDKAKAKAKN